VRSQTTSATPPTDGRAPRSSEAICDSSGATSRMTRTSHRGRGAPGRGRRSAASSTISSSDFASSSSVCGSSRRRCTRPIQANGRLARPAIISSKHSPPAEPKRRHRRQQRQLRHRRSDHKRRAEPAREREHPAAWTPVTSTICSNPPPPGPALQDGQRPTNPQHPVVPGSLDRGRAGGKQWGRK
jgi:hypothetical protein